MSEEAFKKAVETTEGPCVILAGAGTGKTTCMVEKVKYLVSERKCLPEEIVCLTFSNEAARELTRRIHAALDEGALKNGGPMVRTFHGFSSEVLQEAGKQVKVLTPEEGKVVLHRYLRVPLKLCHQYVHSLGTAKDLGVKLEDLERFVKREVERRGLKGKEGLQSLLELKEFELHTLGKDRMKKRELEEGVRALRGLLGQWKFVQAWAAYEKLKEKQGYLDYADLHHELLALFEGGYKPGFKQVIVDEFQDTNRVQLDLVFGLAPGLATTSGGDSQVETVVGARGASSPAPPTVGAEGITVVGDLNQSIYRFRGAYQENLKLFREHFKIGDDRVFALDVSHRCPNTVLRAAHRLITKNYEKDEESFLVENASGREGDKIAVFEMKNGKEEARKVVELVKQSLAEGVPAEEIAVLFRTHQQGQIIRRALEQAGIGFVAVAQRSLLEDSLVRQVRDYLTIVSLLRAGGVGGEQAWWDVVYRLGFPEEDVMRIGKLLRSIGGNNSRSENSNKEREYVCISEILINDLPGLPLSSSGRVLARLLVKRLSELQEFEHRELGELVKECYRICGFVQDEDDDEKMAGALGAFYELAQHHEGLYGPLLGSFLQYLDIMQELGVRLEVPGVEEEGVRVMTLHATKGLEFERVIMTNMAQKRFPSERWGSGSLLPPEVLPELSGRLDGINDEEVVRDYEISQNLRDERRLAYVAMTRTKRKLVMTYARQYGGKNHYPSKFLEELDVKGSKEFDYEVDAEEKWVEPAVSGKLSFGRVLQSGDVEAALAALVQQGSGERVSVQEKKTLSPSALLLFTECQKQFEYKYVYHMPEPKSVHWEAMQLGSFVHKVLEEGVGARFQDVTHFLDLARQKVLEDEWSSVELGEAEGMIKVFFSRSGERLKELAEVKTEQQLRMKLAGLGFLGYADRVDIAADGSVEIVDYKTGRGFIPPKARNWQLGYYALAAEASGLGRVRRVVLDMLRQAKPLSFVLDDAGNAVEEVDGRMKFNVYQVEEELVRTAHEIGRAYKNGFVACGAGSCSFCDQWVYGEN